MAGVRLLVFLLCAFPISAFSTNVSLKCLKDTMEYLSDLNSGEPKTYAILMYDALGKEGSSIVKGNIDRLGSYSECLSAQAPSGNFQGEYCKLQVEQGTPFLAPLPHFITGNQTLLTVNEAVCARGLISTDAFAVLCLCLCAVLIILPITGSIYTGILQARASSSFAHCKSVTSYKEREPNSTQDQPELRSEDSLEERDKDKKAKSKFPQIESRESLVLFYFLLSDNSFEWRAKVLEKPLQFYTLSGPVYLGVDSFFFLSGFLSARSFWNQIEKIGNNITPSTMLKYLYRRLIRLQPLHLSTICISVGIISLVQWGSFWELPKHQWDNCRRLWWSNILLITNFVSISESCSGWSWYLSNDFQFHLTTPLLIFLYVKSKRLMSVTVIALFLASFLTTTLLSFFLRLPIRYPTGENQSRLSYWVEYYTKPYCRYGPFLAGLVLALLMSQKQSPYLKSKAQAVIGWLCSLLTLFLVITLSFVLDDSHDSYSIMAALYQGLHRTIWALALGWIIVSCQEGYGGVLSKMLSCQIWRFLSKISYACYLIHPTIIIFYCGLQETLFHYLDINMFYLFIGHSILTFAAGLALTILVERPFQKLFDI
ncbi:hypothetical protein XELAEV_18008406mg [Xenopus laevis]|uniref:Nose resistant-to-fluoxetine protein N-terminal domain-containing protein n=1 Tax=Xenopus laevis TaxID=8355 RepID=A0A974E423_XENLA|nr:hypothetical protein XELAEV_18008406mg [Xenopus laevis]